MPHDPNFYRDENGNSLVSREPFPCEYVVTAKTGDIERGIAQAAGFRVVELNAEGRVVEPLADYLKDEPDAFSPKWKPLAEKIQSEFHPAPPTDAKGSAPTPVNGEYAEVRFVRGVAPGTVTETFDDGSSCTSSMGRRGRIETPSVQITPRTFNPFTVTMDDYMELRRQGCVPEVRVKGVECASHSRPVDLDAWSEYRSASAKPDEMESWLDARTRGEVPA